MSIDRATTIVGFAGTMIALGIAWANLSGKVERIDERVSELRKNAADDLCLAIVTRQIAAVERGNKDIGQQLERMASARACFDRGRVMAATEAPTDGGAEDAAQAAAWVAMDERQRQAVEDQLVVIDRKLDLRAHGELRAQ